MEFQDVVRKRRMVRAFDARPLPPDVVERIFTNAQRGPSSGFSQGFDFLVFDGPEQTKHFWDAVSPWRSGDVLGGARSAPLLIVPIANPQSYVDTYRKRPEVGRQNAEDFPAPYWFTDTAFASMLILLTSVDAGLGAFYFSIGPTSREIPAFKAAFGIPEDRYPIGAIAIGYAGQSDISVAPETTRSVRERRRTRGSFIHYAQW
jgi:nitroreductase